MDIVPLTADRFADWDTFCLNSADIWFWHTTEWLNYTQNYKPELKSKPISFIVINNGKIIGVSPVFLEIIKLNDGETKELSFGGSPIPMPGLQNGLPEILREKRYKLFFEHIDELAIENGADRITIRGSPLSPNYALSYFSNSNVAMKNGYIPILLNTQIIVLARDEAILWADIRHGHAYDINQGMKYIEVKVFDKSNISKDIYLVYQKLHHKAAGRVTRPQITFDLMYKWILQGYAALFAASIRNEYVGFSYVYTYKNSAYYGSACNDPDYEQEPIGHVLQWRTIQWLKMNGYYCYEIGLQNYTRLPYNIVSQKEIDISTFKRGFGGLPLPYFVGEKYYNSEYYLKVNTDRVQRYASILPDGK